MVEFAAPLNSKKHRLVPLIRRKYCSIRMCKPSGDRSNIRRSLQSGVFRLGLLEDRDVGVGVFPESEEILICSLCPGLISRHSERSAELQVRQCADGIADNDSAVIEN